jgi:hypothetical protein
VNNEVPLQFSVAAAVATATAKEITIVCCTERSNRGDEKVIPWHKKNILFTFDAE